ncbi:MAG: 4-hydroxy-tetrahydrodipicolinate synthase [Chloroflexi bacterium]|nr:4-hydroxy-tetrahydrodipicolinate synthase [Chloroflexota bacterium]
MTTKLQGIFTVLVTPMTAAEEVDYKTLAALIDYVIEEGGVHGIIPLGSTGEYYALTAEERRKVVEATFQAVRGRRPVVVGANATTTREVIEHCQHAEKWGAAGVMLAAPYYSLPTEDELFEHYKAVNDAIHIPIMLYNFPARSGVDLKPRLVQRLAELDNVQYLKESTGDITRVSEIIRLCGHKITLFCGYDSQALENFVLGAKGWVAGASNFIPRTHVKLFDLAVNKGDFRTARELYYKLLPILSVLEGGGKYIQFVKACCGLVGHPVGPPRRPLLPATPDEVAELEKALDQIKGEEKAH